MSIAVVAENFKPKLPSMGLYAGSFDPITRGHFDIIKQALNLFDIVEVAIGINPKKVRLFSPAHSMSLAMDALEEEGISTERVRASHFTGSLMNYARTQNASAVVRGLRQVSDFNDEFTLHGVFEHTMDIPVVYLICKQEYLHVSSSTARELVSLGEPVEWLVHERVSNALVEKFSSLKETRSD